jgi:glutamyl-tRNA reductase
LSAAEAIVGEDVAKYGDWLRSLAVVPTVAAIQERADALRLAELERTLSRMTLSPEDRARIEAMTAALVKKLLHAPIARLKDASDGERYTEAARALFGLDAPDDQP